jgi:hypothetical protein
VAVHHGDVTYTVTGTGNAVEDGKGDSVFTIYDTPDAFDFIISDGAGDDTIVVESGRGDIILGDGADMVWVKSGIVDIFDFVPGEDSLFFGAARDELVVDGSGGLEFTGADGSESAIQVFVAGDGLI